ncbi:CPEB1 [Bugula neritina]|uniref:CPEB1 n=1 Tax=Bugula neritina TaxID=10212 RepID=A0A7J7KC87_BUGNE|nr:CPEB1 [Bugula neritina]
MRSCLEVFGYGYATFRKESSLRAFLSSCQCTERRLTYTLPYAVDIRQVTGVDRQVEKGAEKGVGIQVIPWMIANQQYLTCEKELRETELKYTVFVGNLHGTTTARTLYQAMASAFGGGVVYSAINVDYSKYPIGSGRVTFSNERSYRIAVSTGYLRLCNGHSDKVIQIEPFLDDRMCQTCLQDIGKYFCRSQTPGCFRYFCTACWFNRHSFAFLTDDHIPLTKTKKGFTARANLVKQLPHVKQAETTPRLYCNKLF